MTPARGLRRRVGLGRRVEVGGLARVARDGLLCVGVGAQVGVGLHGGHVLALAGVPALAVVHRLLGLGLRLLRGVGLLLWGVRLLLRGIALLLRGVLLVGVRLLVLLLRVLLLLVLLLLVLRVLLVLLGVLLLLVLRLLRILLLRGTGVGRLALLGLVPGPPLVPVQGILRVPRFGATAPAILSHRSPRAARRKPRTPSSVAPGSASLTVGDGCSNAVSSRGTLPYRDQTTTSTHSPGGLPDTRSVSRAF